MAEKAKYKISRKRALRVILAGLTLAPLTACGKKLPPKKPSGDKAPYPRKYPLPQ